MQKDIQTLTSLVQNQDRNHNASTQLSISEHPHGSASLWYRRVVPRELQPAVADQYHGPYSLRVLSQTFCNDPIFATTAPTGRGLGDNLTIQCMLQQLLIEASNNVPQPPTFGCVGSQLPPRQQLDIAIQKYFGEPNYTTDIFNQSKFQMQVSQAYATPGTQHDQAWLICLNVIILLSIGDGIPSKESILQRLQASINSPSLYLTPRLMNVQALALLVSFYPYAMVSTFLSANGPSG